MGYEDEDGPDPAPDEFEESSEGGGREAMLPFAGGVLLGAAVLALVWMFVGFTNGDSDKASDSPATSQVGSPLAGSLTGGGADEDVAQEASGTGLSQLARCNAAAGALGGPLRAAGPAMDQWAVHIGAMNKLVVGEISLQQATAFWNQTRVGAHQRIGRFHDAMRELRRQGVDCTAPSLLAKTAPAALRSCVRTIDAELRTLGAARTAVNTWNMHVADMERLRSGELSPAAATKMWLSMWQRGVDQLQDYRASARAARQAGGCETAGPAGALTSPSPSAPPPMNMNGMH